MVKKSVFIGLLIAMAGCKQDPSPLSDNSIQISNQAWDFSSKFALVKTAAPFFFQGVFVKIDGTDGSYLCVVLPSELLDSQPPLPAALPGEIYYYPSGSIDAPIYKGDAAVELIELDESIKELKLSFTGVVVGPAGDSKTIQSGAIEHVAFDYINHSSTYLTASVNNDQEEWHASEYGGDMIGGHVDWFLYNPLMPGTAHIDFNIPWGTPIGTYPVLADSKVITYHQGTPYVEWVLESATIHVDLNSFQEAKQTGGFEAVFHHPDNPAEKIMLKNGLLDVLYK